MNIDKDIIIRIITEAAEETTPALADEIKEKGADTKLFGQDAILDSLGLVTLIAATETGIKDQAGIELLLVDEDAMSRKHSPFRTAGTFCDYILEKVSTV